MCFQNGFALVSAASARCLCSWFWQYCHEEKSKRRRNTASGNVQGSLQRIIGTVALFSALKQLVESWQCQASRKLLTLYNDDNAERAPIKRIRACVAGHVEMRQEFCGSVRLLGTLRDTSCTRQLAFLALPNQNCQLALLNSLQTIICHAPEQLICCIITNMPPVTVAAKIRLKFMSVPFRMLEQ